MLSIQATGVVPAQATQFRGLWVTMNGLVCATNDTGQARKYVGGFALEDPSGLLLVTETAPASVPMDGINANAAGAVVKKTGAGSVIHQGIGMTVSAPGGPMVVNQDEPPLVFLAPLHRGINSGSIAGVGTRDSQATYWAEDGTLKIAQVNEIRHEFQNGQPLGALMESASTNKCRNWNANPDAALSGLTLGGEAAASMNRVLDVAALQAAGLNRLATSGYVIQVINPGPSTARVNINGGVSNLNLHTVSMYWRGSGQGGIRLNSAGAANSPAPATYERFVNAALTPTDAGDYAQVLIQPGATIYFLLNQLEEQPASTSVIIIEGAAASRALDQLSWSLTDSEGRNILNSTEGMFAFLWTPQIGHADMSSLQTDLLSCTTAQFSLAYLNIAAADRRIATQDGTPNQTVLQFPGNAINAQQLYLILGRYGGSGKQVGLKTGGAVSWSGEGTYSTPYPQETELRINRSSSVGAYFNSLNLWSEDKGTAWLESYFSGVAN